MQKVIDYVEIWDADKRGIIDTMRRNLASDIVAGYNICGRSVRKQMMEIEDYEIEYEKNLKAIKNMAPVEAQRWCRRDLKKHGAID